VELKVSTVGSIESVFSTIRESFLKFYSIIRGLNEKNTGVRVSHSRKVYASIGRPTFSYTAAHIWDVIPLNIYNSPSVSSFKRYKFLYFIVLY